MKLLTQGDDYGFTKAVTLGIIEGIDNGILRNTGMFTNMPAAKLAAELMKGREFACFGIDFNLVSGYPVSDPKDVPHLVDENGEFIRSGVRIKDPRRERLSRFYKVPLYVSPARFEQSMYNRVLL